MTPLLVQMSRGFVGISKRFYPYLPKHPLPHFPLLNVNLWKGKENEAQDATEYHCERENSNVRRRQNMLPFDVHDPT